MQQMSRLMTKPTNWHVRPAKTQISLGICPVWSESLLSTWRKLGSSATHWVHSEDSNQTGWMPRLIWVFAGHTCHFVGFVMKRLRYSCWKTMHWISLMLLLMCSWLLHRGEKKVLIASTKSCWQSMCQAISQAVFLQYCLGIEVSIFSIALLCLGLWPFKIIIHNPPPPYEIWWGEVCCFQVSTSPWFRPNTSFPLNILRTDWLNLT